jgi:adenylate cyclase
MQAPSVEVIPYPRRHATVLHADVKDYSKLMAADEEATVRDLQAAREHVTRHILRHGGRLVDTAGDGFLAEFSDSVAAVACAFEFQADIRRRNASVPVSRRMVFRVGISVGEVLVHRNRIFGNAVNLAARLEKLAKPGAICISGPVHDQVKDHLPLNYRSLGFRRLRSFPEPLRVYTLNTEAPARPVCHARCPASCSAYRFLRRLIAQWPVNATQAGES